MKTIPLATARRIALAAQGFAKPRPTGTIGRGHLKRTLTHTGLFQIDSVSVLARAHYLPAFSRLGPYPRALLETMAWKRPRTLFEYWAHEASLLPIETQPLLRWRMARAAEGHGIYGGLARFGRERRDFIEEVFEEVVRRGPVGTSEFDGPAGEGGWWGWSDTKRALEWLFWAGRITTASRRGFARLYDLPERVLPAAILAMPTPEPAEAHRRLIAIAARAHGIATASDLRDYFRLSPDVIKARLPELVETGELLPVEVRGWSQPTYLSAEARIPRRVDACALLAPFDPLIWERSRTERLFGFHYRIEIYVPAEKRRFGYYVLPFLLGDRLVARIDLKSDRKEGALKVVASYAEPDAPAHTAEALAGELRSMAGWLDLDRVVVEPQGDLALALAGAVAPMAQQG
ncbi:winged helix-turn-helix domain-containing protein [Consotaella aegiceratis]|uniref:winged helix-turn-helix domain-containing protein n=1 Tax=Consotaella aegiceratis TaxID=3097961 RepID=UPI002F4275E7